MVLYSDRTKLDVTGGRIATLLMHNVSNALVQVLVPVP